MNFLQKYKKKLILYGIVLLLVATGLAYQKFNYLWKETNFYNITHKVDEISLTLSVFPEGYASPDWNPDSEEKVDNYFVDLKKESQEMTEILDIIGKYSYELHADSVATKNRSYGKKGYEDEKYLLDLSTLDRIFGFPTIKTVAVMNDLGNMNVNKRTYQMNPESANKMLEELLAYLETHPEITSVA